jgi:hypothetical protein
LGVHAVKEVHPNHHQAGNVEQVEHQLRPCLLQPEVTNAIKHDTYRHHSRHGGNANVENLRILIKPCFHDIL